VVQTIGLGADLAIIENKLDLGLDGTYTKSNGKVDFASPLGTAATDQNDYTPLDFGNSDDTKRLDATAKFTYQLTKAWETVLGYQYERWDIDDYLYDGLTPVKSNTSASYGGLLNMDTYYKDYTVHTIWAGAKYSF